MSSNQILAESLPNPRKRSRPWNDSEDEDFEMTDRDEPARQIAQPSPRSTNLKATKDCRDGDIFEDVTNRPESKIVLTLKTKKARDSMSPGSPGSLAKQEGKAPTVPPVTRPTSLNGFQIPPGGRLFRRPSVFTGTHFIVNRNREIELPLRGPHANGNIATLGATHQQVATVTAAFRSWSPDFLQLCTQMLLSKQDAVAVGFNWSLPDFQQLYYQINGWNFPTQFVSKLSAEEQRHILDTLCEQAIRRAAGSLRPLLRPILGSDLTAVINGLPHPATLPSVRNANQPLLSIESNSGPSNVVLPTSSLPASPIRQTRNQSPAPPTLTSQLIPIRGRRPFSSLSGSSEGQPLPSRDPNGRRGAHRRTRAERPTRSSERREERERRRSDSVTGATQRLTIHGIYECCCPHCGFAGESYVKFKRHIAEHFEKDGWTEYRCPMKGCDETFAKSELTRYLRYLEFQGLIRMKGEPPRDPISRFYFKFKWHIKNRDMRVARQYEMARLRTRNNVRAAEEERRKSEATHGRDAVEVAVEDDDEDEDEDDDDDDDDDADDYDEDAWLDDLDLPED